MPPDENLAPERWIDPEYGQPSCPACNGLGYFDKGPLAGERCEVCEGAGIADVIKAQLWIEEQS